MVGAGFDFIAAGRAAGSGDYVQGGLYLTSGVGGTITALAAGGVWGGPAAWVGIGLIGLSTAGLIAWDQHKKASAHEPYFDGGASTRFLKHLGSSADGKSDPLSDTAIEVLTDQSGDGHSMLPLLKHYAELKGVNLNDPNQQGQFVEWINQMPKNGLSKLRRHLHITLDKSSGDVSQFKGTQANDNSWKPIHEEWRGNHFVSRHNGPTSAVQMDKLLASYGLKPLGS